MIDFTIKQTVIDLMTEYPHIMDSDDRLIATIWNRESKGIESKYELLKMLADGKLTSPESIRRMRQKIQEENPALRGLTWEKRHKKQKKVKQNLGYAV